MLTGMMKVVPVTLRGRHVTLEPLTEEHLPGLLKAGEHDEIWTYMPRALTTPAALRSWYEEAMAAKERGEVLPFAIVHNESRQPVGSTRYLEITPEHFTLEIGWTWLTPALWRTAVNTECKYLLLSHAFDSLHAMRVQLKTDARNDRSRDAILRLGAKFEGILRNHRIVRDGRRRDSAYYSILDEEWSEVRGNLRAMLGFSN